MSLNPNASDELKNAFADQELAIGDRRELQARALADPDLRRELCEISAIKGLVRDAYGDTAGSGDARRTGDRRRTGRTAAMRFAAVAVLCVTTGWVAHASWPRGSAGEEGQVAVAAAAVPAQSDSLAWLSRNRVVLPQAASHEQVLLHVSTRDPEDLRAALDAAESLMAKASRGEPGLQVEIVANSAGIDLFRAGVSPEADRIAALVARYPSLRLIACRQSMDRVRERGESVVLLPGVDVVPTALDEIIARLQKGWVYVRT
jgi:intracellular sulfur oxidation DsrE/DsrF family protein